jgi:hypothetical protein
MYPWSCVLYFLLDIITPWNDALLEGVAPTSRHLVDTAGAAMRWGDELMVTSQITNSYEYDTHRIASVRYMPKPLSFLFPGLGGVNHCRLHCRLAKFRGLMRRGKYGAVIG